MPKLIPENSIQQVITCRFEGKSRKETCQITRVSETKIQQIWNEFSQKVGQANFEALTKIGEFASSKGLSFVQWTDEFCTRQRLDKLGIKIDESLDSFVDEVYCFCKDKKISVPSLIKEITCLKNLSSRTGIPIGKMSTHFSELDGKTKQLAKEYNREKQNLLKINQDVKSAEKERKDMLLQNNVTQEKLDEYVSSTKIFEKFGISSGDHAKAAQVITKIKNYGWLDSKIIKHLTEKSEHSEQIKQQQKKMDSNNSIILKQDQTINHQKNEIKSNDSEISKQKSRIKELKKQEKQTIQSLDIRHGIYEAKVQEFFSATKKSLDNLQRLGESKIEQTSEKNAKEHEQFFALQRKEFKDLISVLDNEIPKVIDTVKKVAALKSIEPINRLISLKSIQLETVQAAILVLELFVVMYERDLQHNSLILSQAKNLLRYLKGELKRRF